MIPTTVPAIGYAETLECLRRHVEQRRATVVRQYILELLRSPARDRLFPEIRRMPRRWQQVLQILFGFSLDGGTVDMDSGRALAKKWGVTPPSIFQMRDKALRQLALCYFGEHPIL